MRTVCRNALKMLKILHQAEIKTCLETEQTGTFPDSVTAVILAGFFQIEEVLIPKINSSPAKGFVELYARVMENEKKRYL